MAEYVNKSTLYSLCEPRGVVTLHVSDIDAMPSEDVAPVVHARWLIKAGQGILIGKLTEGGIVGVC